MAGQGEGKGQGTAKLENQIACIKYTLFCFNIVCWLIGAAVFVLAVWVRAEQGFEELIQILEVNEFFIGIYVLIFTGIVVMIVSFLGCCSALMEHTLALGIFIGTQVLVFIAAVLGAGILLSFSTVNSAIQPLIHRTMTRLIITSGYEPSGSTLRLIQESIGCCGADGSNDYLNLRQPLPTECRDTVSGNVHFNGCVEELTWFLEDKSAWIAGLAMAVALIAVIDAVLSIVLVQALRKEEEEARTYRH